MKYLTNLTTGLTAVALLILIALGCSKSDSNTAANTTPANANSSDNKNTSTSSSNPASGGDITGSYNIAGKNPNGQAYSGGLVVKKRGEVFQFTWTTDDGHSYDGAAVQGGNLVAAGFTNGSDGKGCGAVVYKIGDTSMDGKLAVWGIDTVATQTATLVSSTKTSGKFKVEGMDVDGSPIDGTLDIKQNGDIYQLSYGGKIAFHGTGYKQDDYLVAGVGKPTCAFALYEIKNGGLSGIWGGIGANKYGTEIATRK